MTISPGPQLEPTQRPGWWWTVSDCTAMVWRGLLYYRRQPTIILWQLGFPIVSVLLFVYVFGSAMDVGEGADYKAYAMPGMFAMTMAFGFMNTAYAMVVELKPAGDDTSLYHIFERLNSGGRRLTDQEMRLAIYHGSLIDLVKDLNDYAPWRKIFGKPHTRLKDQELILRLFALFMDLMTINVPCLSF